MSFKEFPSFTLPALRSGIPKSADDPTSSRRAAVVIQDWAQQLNTLLADTTGLEIGTLFHPEAWLRDTLALSWDLRTVQGRDSIAKYISGHNGRARLRNIQPRETHRGDAYAPEVKRVAPGVEWVQSMFTFETNVGSGKGLVRLVQGTEPGKWEIYLMSLILQELVHFPERTLANRPHGGSNSLREGPVGGAWKEFREKQQRFLNDNPTTLIVGAGMLSCPLPFTRV
jgi:hypothetical protein